MAKLKKANKGKVFYVGTHKHGFRAGEPAEIIGVVMVAPDHCHHRPCFHVRFKNGDDDYMPIEDSSNYQLISGEDVKMGRIPAVNH